MSTTIIVQQLNASETPYFIIFAPLKCITKKKLNDWSFIIIEITTINRAVLGYLQLISFESRHPPHNNIIFCPGVCLLRVDKCWLSFTVSRKIVSFWFLLNFKRNKSICLQYHILYVPKPADVLKSYRLGSAT